MTIWLLGSSHHRHRHRHGPKVGSNSKTDLSPKSTPNRYLGPSNGIAIVETIPHTSNGQVGSTKPQAKLDTWQTEARAHNLGAITSGTRCEIAIRTGHRADRPRTDSLAHLSILPPMLLVEDVQGGRAVLFLRQRLHPLPAHLTEKTFLLLLLIRVKALFRSCIWILYWTENSGGWSSWSKPSPRFSLRTFARFCR